MYEIGHQHPKVVTNTFDLAQLHRIKSLETVIGSIRRRTVVAPLVRMIQEKPLKWPCDHHECFSAFPQHCLDEKLGRLNQTLNPICKTITVKHLNGLIFDLCLWCVSPETLMPFIDMILDPTLNPALAAEDPGRTLVTTYEFLVIFGC